jgi:hypothetical protein
MELLEAAIRALDKQIATHAENCKELGIDQFGIVRTMVVELSKDDQQKLYEFMHNALECRIR